MVKTFEIQFCESPEKILIRYTDLSATFLKCYIFEKTLYSFHFVQYMTADVYQMSFGFESLLEDWHFYDCRDDVEILTEFIQDLENENDLKACLGSVHRQYHDDKTSCLADYASTSTSTWPTLHSSGSSFNKFSCKSAYCSNDSCGQKKTMYLAQR